MTSEPRYGPFIGRVDRWLFKPSDNAASPLANSVSRIGRTEPALVVPPMGGVLVFDGYCGFCTRSVRALLGLDRKGRVRALPLQGPDVLRVTELVRDDALREAHWIGADGVRRSGAGAMAAAFSAATGWPALVLYRLPVVRRLADRVYRWVAEHRYLLRGVTPYCETATPGECDAIFGESYSCAADSTGAET